MKPALVVPRVRGRAGDLPVYGTVIGDADISRFFAGLLMRLMAMAFAVALAAAGHGVSSMDSADAVDTIHQANETGVER